jgi:serine/threonine-protein kinase
MAHATTAETVSIRPVACEPPPVPRKRRSQPDDTLARNSRLGAWRVCEELGRGGMASVHAVVHSKFGKRAAIKIAHRSVLGGSYTADTFLREARIVHAVAHPGVIDIFATGSHDGRPFLVMEKLIGRPLGTRIDLGPTLSRVEALEILIELCDILRAAHASGIVHRDLKLDNVFLLDTPYSRDRRVKLLDWGVAYVEGEDDPFHGLIAGTLAYVAPEQIRGSQLTSATDVYSLGVLAFHLLCRQAPFVAPTDLALIHLHLRAAAPRASEVWPQIPTALDTLLFDMLAKNPGDRPSVDAIEHVLRATLEQLVAPESSFFDLPAQPPIDVFCRPALPVPPFKPMWIGLALALTGIAGLISALP